METSAVWTSLFGEAGPAVTARMFLMCRELSVAATDFTLALSALVSFPPSARANTMIAASAVTFPACGNALSCRLEARIDS